MAISAGFSSRLDAMNAYLDTENTSIVYETALVNANKIFDRAAFHEEKQDYDDALKGYLECLELVKPLGDGDLDLIKKVNHGLGNVYKALDRNFDALEWYNKYLEVATEQDDEASKAEVLFECAFIYETNESCDDALKYYLDCLNLAEKLENQDLIKEINCGLGNVYEALNRNSDALECYNKYREIATEQNDKKSEAEALRLIKSMEVLTI